MNLDVAVPALMCLLFALALGCRPLRIHPAWSARLLVTAAVVAAAAVMSMSLATTAAYAREGAAHEPGHPHVLAGLTGHRPVNDVLGVASALTSALLVAAAARAALRIGAERRRMRSDAAELNASSERMAVAVPGRDGGIVLSIGLRAMLTSRELRAVIAHERAHLRHRHHRYLAASAICAAALPCLRGLDENLRLAVERWADEDAAAALGDRHLVARTIAKVALPSTAPSTLPALAETGVSARVGALLVDAPGTSRFAPAALLLDAAVAGSGMAALLVQLHHLGAP